MMTIRNLILVLLLGGCIGSASALELDDIRKDLDQDAGELAPLQIGASNKVFIEHNIKATVHAPLGRYLKQSANAAADQPVVKPGAASSLNICSVHSTTPVTKINNVCIFGIVQVLAR